MSGYGALIFCSGRQRSQATAVLISDAVPTEQISVNVLDKRSQLIASLQALPRRVRTTLFQDHSLWRRLSSCRYGLVNNSQMRAGPHSVGDYT